MKGKEFTINLHDNIGYFLANGEGKGVIKSAALYEGYNHYDSDEIIFVDIYEEDNVSHKIVGIEPACFSHHRKIKKIYIGPHVQYIEWNQYQCSSLEDIIVDPQNQHYLDQNGVLYSADKKTLVGYPHSRTGSYVVPNGTRKIGNTAFKSCNISSLILPDTLTEIGINAFYECNNLKEIILPDTIKIIKGNCDVAHNKIRQRFYFKSDKNLTNSYSINEIMEIVNK